MSPFLIFWLKTCTNGCCIYPKNYSANYMEYSSSWEANKHLVKCDLLPCCTGIWSLETWWTPPPKKLSYEQMVYKEMPSAVWFILVSKLAHSDPEYVSPNIIWLSPYYRHYTTSWKVKGSILDEVTGFFSVYLILPATLWPLTEMSMRNLPGSKARPACKAGYLTTICEPIA
jgi:hypothetical protein